MNALRAHVECTGGRGAGRARGGAGGVFTARRGGERTPPAAGRSASVVVGHSERARTAPPGIHYRDSAPTEHVIGVQTPLFLNLKHTQRGPLYDQRLLQWCKINACIFRESDVRWHCRCSRRRIREVCGDFMYDGTSSRLAESEGSACVKSFES